VWIIRDGSSAETVAGIPPGNYEDPRLSPDGKRLLLTLDSDIWMYEFESDGHTLSVHQHRPAGTVIHMIALDSVGEAPRPFAERESTAAEGADFARDGRHVVYSAMEAGRREIFIRPYPDPGDRTTVSVNGGREPRWAGEVFYRTFDGDQMFAVQTTTSPTVSVGKPQPLFAGKYYVAQTGSPRPQYDVTADGKRFLMLQPTAAGAERPRIVVVQHWLEELKRLLPSS
jgi:hypothetical protein